MEAKQPQSLREARTERGLTQEALAVSVGVHQVTVSQWELGGIDKPSGSACILLAQVLEVTLDVVNGWFRREERAA